jgi:phospholipid/cholesterol/gamma-HCH transport system ATP-binding protein
VSPPEPTKNAGSEAKIEIRDLTMAFGSFVVMRDINAKIRQAEIFVIIGGSGCGKSTLLRHMIGLKAPAQGDIYYDGQPFWQGSEESRQERLRTFGVLFQSGALWSSMTLMENVELPLGEYTDLAAPDIQDIARLKLALVGLKGFEDYYPRRFPAACANARDWRAPWPWTRKSSSLMNPPRGWTRSLPATWTS